jgi:hypothetical protein
VARGRIKTLLLGENSFEDLVFAQLDEIRRHMREMSNATRRVQNLVLIIGEKMATQQDIDNLVGRVNAVETAINDGVAGIRSDIEALKVANPRVDTSALEASVAQLEGSVGGLTALDAENPAAPVDPEPEPV